MQAAVQVASPDVRAPRCDPARESDSLWMAGICTFLCVQLLRDMVTSSFWLDETGTWWIVNAGRAEAINRALSWGGHSRLYFVIPWVSSQLFGLNETALRAPSVLAMAGAVYILYRIAATLVDRRAAAMSAFLFFCTGSFYAFEARPYAFAFLFLTGSTWFLLRWLRSGRPRDALLYIATATLVVYVQVLLSVGLAPGVIYAVAQLRHDRRRLAALAAFPFAIALLSVPLVRGMLTFYAGRSSHTIAGPPTPNELLAGLIPCSIAGGLILLAWIYARFRSESGIEFSAGATLLIGAWAFFPPLLLFLVSAFTDLKLFVPRYYSSALPGQAILAGGLLASIISGRTRKALILTIGAITFLTSGKNGNEDWRGAMKFLRKEAGPSPVLLVSGFAEAGDFAALRDPELRDVLFAPELMYGEPQRSIHLPNSFNGQRSPELDSVVKKLKGEPRFYLLTETVERTYQMWLLGAMASAGEHCTAQGTGSFGYVFVWRFNCELP